MIVSTHDRDLSLNNPIIKVYKKGRQHITAKIERTRSITSFTKDFEVGKGDITEAEVFNGKAFIYEESGLFPLSEKLYSNGFINCDYKCRFNNGGLMGNTSVIAHDNGIAPLKPGVESYEVSAIYNEGLADDRLSVLVTSNLLVDDDIIYVPITNYNSYNNVENGDYKDLVRSTSTTGRKRLNKPYHTSCSLIDEFDEIHMYLPDWFSIYEPYNYVNYMSVLNQNVSYESTLSNKPLYDSLLRDIGKLARTRTDICILSTRSFNEYNEAILGVRHSGISVQGRTLRLQSAQGSYYTGFSYSTSSHGSRHPYTEYSIHGGNYITNKQDGNVLCDLLNKTKRLFEVFREKFNMSSASNITDGVTMIPYTVFYNGDWSKRSYITNNGGDYLTYCIEQVIGQNRPTAKYKCNVSDYNKPYWRLYSDYKLGLAPLGGSVELRDSVGFTKLNLRDMALSAIRGRVVYPATVVNDAYFKFLNTSKYQVNSSGCDSTSTQIELIIGDENIIIPKNMLNVGRNDVIVYKNSKLHYVLANYNNDFTVDIIAYVVYEEYQLNINSLEEGCYYNLFGNGINKLSSYEQSKIKTNGEIDHETLDGSINIHVTETTVSSRRGGIVHTEITNEAHPNIDGEKVQEGESKSVDNNSTSFYKAIIITIVICTTLTLIL